MGWEGSRKGGGGENNQNALYTCMKYQKEKKNNLVKLSKKYQNLGKRDRWLDLFKRHQRAER